MPESRESIVKYRASIVLLMAFPLACHRAPTTTWRNPVSASIIQTTPDDKLEQLIVDAVINRIGKDDEHKREIIVSMPKGFRFIYATWLLEAEVNNGGFNQ